MPLVLRSLPAADRILALADPGSVAAVDDVSSDPRRSPHLARWGIEPQDDDGIVLARATIFGARVLVAAEDERFLAGSAGARHADAMRGLFARARNERPAAVVLLAASAGVRLYEANPAELALARALAALLDLRATGVRVLALGVGDVFGGASVLACAAERFALLPGTKLGLSGPRVIEMTHGRNELDARDAAAVAALFGAETRATAGEIDLVADQSDAVRAWIATGMRDDASFEQCIYSAQARLADRWARRERRRGVSVARRARAEPPRRSPLASFYADAQSLDPAESLWRMNGLPVWLTQAAGQCTFGPGEAHALDGALLAQFASGVPPAGATLLLIEDSLGHEATAAAEALCISQYLAQHAAVLALLRARGVRTIGVLIGTGHSAAFFSNALQASVVYALPEARVVAMEPPAIARVTGLDSDRLAALIEDDPVLGHPVRHFAALGGIADLLPDASPERLLRLLA